MNDTRSKTLAWQTAETLTFAFWMMQMMMRKTKKKIDEEELKGMRKRKQR
jgi:hypothetical protein